MRLMTWRALSISPYVQARYAANHKRLCDQRPLTCSNAPSCAWTGKRADLDAHLEECLHEVVPCGYVDSTDGAVRRCRIPVSKPVLKALMVSALDTRLS